MSYLFKNATVVTGEQILENHDVLVEKEKITKVASEITAPKDAEIIDVKGDYLIPGLIDLQVNGGAGAFFTKDLTEESIQKMGEAHMEFGTTSFLPTLISTSFDMILTAIEITKKCIGKWGVLGMHLEGPYFNKKKKGAHFEKFIHNPTEDEIKQLCKHGKDVIKLLTLAPEITEPRFIRMLVDNNIKVSAGHSNATYDEAMDGFKNGISKVTHLFNAMSQFNSRNPGLVGAFFNSNSWGAIIVDGVHVDFAAVNVAYTLAKGRLFLVSDASFVKHPVKHFKFDGFDIKNIDGNYYTEEGNLAGASISLYDAFKNCVERLNLPLLDAVKMSTAYPAEFLGVGHEIGYIKEGLKADILILDKALLIREVFKNGIKKT